LTVRLSLLSTADEVIELFAMRQLTLQLVALGQKRRFCRFGLMSAVAPIASQPAAR
jgi:hypothetical protein